MMNDLIAHTDLYSSINYSPTKLVLSEGKGSKVWDIDGKEYIDCISGFSVVNHGHCHPKIIEAFQQQSQKITMISRALYSENLGQWEEKICKLTNKDKVLPMNILDNIHYIDFGDVEHLKSLINNKTTAIILEPIQGEGGVNIPPDYFIETVRALCDEHNILFIADEIQVGLGRTGKMLATEWEGVEADIYLLGKSLGGGLYPISAVLANKEIMEVLTPGTHGSTFGGNPLACAVSMAALDVLVDEDLINRSAELGQKLLNQLQLIDSDLITDVRGRGLFIGIELNENAQPYCLEMIDQGVLCKETQGNIIRIAPPLVISEEEINKVVEVITNVLKK
jgi:ornithine--oxo-acid transaminase